MTGSEMIAEFRIGYDIIDSGSNLGFTDTHIYSILNRAQDYIIDELYQKKNNDLYGSIIKEIGHGDAPSSSISGNSARVELPTDYWRYITSTCDITKTGFSSSGIIKSLTGTMTVSNKYINQSDFKKLDVDTSNLGYNSNVLYKEPRCSVSAKSTIDNNLYIKGDVYTTITAVTITYLKKRADISAIQNCELAEKVHRQVVDKAIDSAKIITNVQEPQSTKTS